MVLTYNVHHEGGEHDDPSPAAVGRGWLNWFVLRPRGVGARGPLGGRLAVLLGDVRHRRRAN